VVLNVMYHYQNHTELKNIIISTGRSGAVSIQGPAKHFTITLKVFTLMSVIF
jgi:hypothetical protein